MKLKDIQFEKKFEKIFEDVVAKYKNGGFLAGDLVKIKKNALKHPYVQGMSQQYQEMIKNAIETDLNLRLSSVKSLRQNASGAYGDVADAPDNFYADIVIEYAPGLWRDPITLPLELLDRVDTEGNLAPVPDSLKKKSKSTKPEKVEVSDKDRKNPESDTKLPNNKNAVDGRTQVEKPKPYKESVSLEEAYNQMINPRSSYDADFAPGRENEMLGITTTDDINNIIQSLGPDYEPDWRDSQEIEIHNFPSDDNKVDELITVLQQKGVEVVHWDFRYENTLRLNFAKEYYD